MVGTGAQEHDEGVLRAVRPGEAAALVETFQQAQAAEAAVRGLLAPCGIPASVARPVASLDDDGRPVVHLTPNTADREQLVTTIHQAIRSARARPTDAA